ncbi:MAG: 3-deoxy-D-manno-octulosonic acid transferase [Deltaproteobacteria bacterium]|nr:3-deoxy-D-manno-octulosonic acid transferase [Deltaproteobacteria bacterium]
MYVLYNILLLIAALLALPYYALKMILTGKYRKSLGPKFGLTGPEIFKEMKGSPRIWIHAVSVGEVTAAAPVVASLKTRFPEACIILSTGTETGQEMARRIITAASFIYYPLDIPWVVRKVIRSVKPDIFILTETELWPNFIRTCREQGIQIIMVNGRISPRSYKKYAMTRFFWKDILNTIGEMGVISEIDAERLKALGMLPSRIHVMGNAKYDSLAAKASPEIQEEIARRLNMTKDDRVIVAGSTHDGEEKIVLTVYRSLLKTYPDFKLIIIPRHPERGQAVLALAREAGFNDCITMTEMNGGRCRTGEPVIVVDVIGELFKLYSLASIVFCGGSLVPKGGQNILEPAAWGKVIFYGPFMGDFRDEKELLEKTGAGITIGSGEELLDGILTLVSDPDSLAKRGDEGRKMVVKNMGAAERYSAMIQSRLIRNNSQH